MNNTIKNFMYAGIGGAVAYGVIAAVTTALITGTDSSSTMWRSIVPLVVAAGVVWLLVREAFKD